MPDSKKVARKVNAVMRLRNIALVMGGLTIGGGLAGAFGGSLVGGVVGGQRTQPSKDIVRFSELPAAEAAGVFVIN
ncbi:MAG: hypothetical protein ABID38_00675 [Candidatus Diapherotrites archaeon]